MATPQGDSYGCASGGVIAAGRRVITALKTAAAALSAGQMVELPCVYLNTRDAQNLYPTDGSANYTLMPWTVKMGWDSVSQRAMIYTERAMAWEQNGAWSALIWFDAKADTWGHLRNPFGRMSGHGYDSNAFDQRARILYKAPYNSAIIERWDSANWQALTSINAPPSTLGPVTGTLGGVLGLVVHPNFGSSGSLIVVEGSERGRIYRRDLASGVWTQIAATFDIELQTVAHYNSHSDVVVCGGAATGQPLYMVSSAGVVTATDNCLAPVQSHYSGNQFFPDPASHKSLLFSTDGHLYELDTLTGEWSDSGAYPAPLNQTDETYDSGFGVSIPEYNCILFAQGSSGSTKTYIYKHTAG